MKPNQECLLVLDSRTGASHRLPIENNCIKASDISKINPIADKSDAPEQAPRPLRIFDPGYEHTASVESSITLIDGQKGEIRYRGHMIEDLFAKYVYEDVMYLLIWGEIPSAEQKAEVRRTLYEAMVPNEAAIKVIEAFPKESEPYNMIMAGLSVMSSFDVEMATTRHQQKPMYHSDVKKADKALLRTIGYMATCVALVDCHKHGKTFTQPQPHRSLIGNLLLMMGLIGENDGEDSKVERSLDKLWILYADHEMTCSTSAVLHAGSTLIDPTSCMMAGVIAGHGPLHGGAIELAYEGFEQIGSAENVPPLLEAVKAKKARLFGYGHRVLKKRDPRAALIKEIKPMDELHSHNPLLQIALELDRAARKDPYFIERGLHANVDLYGSFPYLALGFERDIVTSVIILSRFGGCMAHWRESLTQPVKLWRPQQSYVPSEQQNGVSSGAVNGATNGHVNGNLNGVSNGVSASETQDVKANGVPNGISVSS